MANVIKIKRGSGTPSTSNLAEYQLGYDYTNNKLYIHDPTNSSGQEIVEVGGSGATTSGSNNQILTDDGSGGINSESSLTFDGDFKVTGSGGSTFETKDFDGSNGYLMLSGTSTQRIEFRNTSNNANGWIGIPSWNTDAFYAYLPTSNGNELGYIFESSRHNLYRGVTINNGQGDYDFIVKGNSNSNLIKTDAGNDRVGIGLSAPGEMLHVDGSIEFAHRKYNTGNVSVAGAGTSNAVAVPLSLELGTTLNVNYQYKIVLNTIGTGTDTGATYILTYNQDGGAWKLHLVSRNGSSSNHPLALIDGSNLKVYHNHTGTYNIRYFIEFWDMAADDGTLHGWGSDFMWTRDVNTLSYTDGKVEADIDLGSGSNTIKKTFATNNYPAVTVHSSGTGDTGAAIAIQQATSEGDTIIFADFEPHVEWGISAENSNNRIDFTGGSSSPSLGTRTFKNNSGSSRTAYRKMSVRLDNGNVDIAGNLTVANGSAYAGDSTSGVWSTGSWAGDLTSNGWERVAGVSHDGGEVALVEKNAQMSVLVDGSYFAYEAGTNQGGGFYSSSNSNYGGSYGFEASGSSVIFKAADGTWSNPVLEIRNTATSTGSGPSLVFGHSQSGTNSTGRISTYLTDGSQAGRSAVVRHWYRQSGTEHLGLQLGDTSGYLRLYRKGDTSDYLEIIRNTDHSQFRIPSGGNYHKFMTESGYVNIGPQNSSWNHFYTDRPGNYFSKKVTVDTGIVESYDEDLQLRRAQSSSNRIDVANGYTRIIAGNGEKFRVSSDGRVNYNGWTGVDHITVRSNGHTNSASSSTFYIKFCTVVVDNSPSNYNGLNLSGTLYNGDNNHGNTIDWSVWFNAGLDSGQIAHGGYMMSKGAHWISNILVQRTAGDGEIDNGSCTYELYYDINNNWANNFYNVATEVHYPSEGKFNVTWNHDQSEVTSLPGTQVVNVVSQTYDDSNQTLVPTGAPGAPAYSFFAQRNTGMYGFTDNTIGFSNNGTRMLSIKADGNLELRNDGSSQGAYIQRVGGVQFTWDRDSYGTSNDHAILSDSDSIKINSFDDVTINLDSNNNDSSETFDVRKHSTTLTGGTLLFQVNGSGNAHIDGTAYIRNTGSSPFALGELTNTLRMKGNGTNGFNFLSNTNGWAHLNFNIAYADGYFQANNNGTLLRLYKSSWSNATTHDIIYNAYGTNFGDYTYLKSAGNSSGTHGIIVAADSYIFMGRDNLTTGAIDNSATAPITDCNFRLDSSGNGLFDGDVVAYSTTIASDAKLKENVKDLNYGLKDVLDIRPVSFDWKDKRDGQHDIGVIAQEIEKIIPEVVVEVDTLNSEDTHKTVDYAKLTSVLIKAVQEQQQQINELKEKLNV